MSKDLEIIKDFLKKNGTNPKSAGESFFINEKQLEEFKVKYLVKNPNAKFFVKKEAGRFHLLYINLKIITKENEKIHEKVFEAVSEQLEIKNNLKESKSFDPSRIKFNLFRD